MADEPSMELDLNDIVQSMGAQIAQKAADVAMAQAQIAALQRDLTATRSERDQLAQMLAEQTAKEANGKATAKS